MSAQLPRKNPSNELEKTAGKMPRYEIRYTRGLCHKLFQGGGHGRAEVRGRFDATDASGAHGSVFVFCGALATADDGTGMAHAAARRCRLSGDEADNWFFHAGLDPFGGFFFGITADFANQNDCMRVGIVVE